MHVIHVYDILFLKIPILEALCLEYLLVKSRVCVCPSELIERSSNIADC